ncbi:hypothetical protein DL96DRAFT_257 [Flagelloscypha sp. PMI_526]|nr:hypothetical protein DL96DRAFT_257 [Flagelloscypha sp. PMI_526]
MEGCLKPTMKPPSFSKAALNSQEAIQRAVADFDHILEHAQHRGAQLEVIFNFCCNHIVGEDAHPLALVAVVSQGAYLKKQLSENFPSSIKTFFASPFPKLLNALFTSCQALDDLINTFNINGLHYAIRAKLQLFNAIDGRLYGSSKDIAIDSHTLDPRLFTKVKAVVPTSTKELRATAEEQFKEFHALLQEYIGTLAQSELAGHFYAAVVLPEVTHSLPKEIGSSAPPHNPSTILPLKAFVLRSG